MERVLFLTFTFLSSTLAYHDPDLNYHLSQVQNVPSCDYGYSYPKPAVQLAAKAPVPTLHGYSNAAGISQNLLFEPAPSTVTYAQPAVAYQAPILNSGLQSQYASQNEVHGYKTSAGLSASSTRTVIPQATYAQAPIISKITAAPLQAKFSYLPSKNSYHSQNSISYSGSYENEYNSQNQNAVVSQVYAAPRAQYSTSPNLKIQAAPAYTTFNQNAPVYRSPPIALSSQLSAPVNTYYSSSGSSAASIAAQYSSSAQSVAPASQVTAYSTAPARSGYSSSVPQYSAAAHYTPVQYSAPAVTQYAAPVVQYSAPSGGHYAASSGAQYSTSTVAHTAPVIQTVAVAQRVTPTVIQHARPAAQYASTGLHSGSAISNQAIRISHQAAPVAQVSHAPATVAVAPVNIQVSSKTHAVKNVHTEFIENYV